MVNNAYENGTIIEKEPKSTHVILKCILGSSVRMGVVTARAAGLTCVSLGFAHSSFVFAQEANMHENKFNSYKVPSGLLILFLEKALTLIHMETHLTDVSITITKLTELMSSVAAQSLYSDVQ
mgnify:CR=1 FL=1